MNTVSRWQAFLGAALIGAGFASAALAESNATKTEAAIPFANRGGIRDWQADRDRGLWVQDVHGKWYYATLMAPCIGLNFANSIGFDTRPIGTFDRFSAIVVPRSGRCAVTSLAPSGAPPSRHKKAIAPAPDAPGS
jgi:hypothetical protein